MRKFIYHSGKGQPTIYECELVLVQPRPWECKDDEQLYMVDAPEQFKGEKWYSQFFYDTPEQCYQYAKEMMKVEVENSFRKKREILTEQMLVEIITLKATTIRVEML